MHATVRRNEAVVGKWTGQALSRDKGEAVRDLLQFEGFRSHDNWMRQPGSWSAG
jgi:hypothetical protein